MTVKDLKVGDLVWVTTDKRYGILTENANPTAAWGVVHVDIGDPVDGPRIIRVYKNHVELEYRKAA